MFENNVLWKKVAKWAIGVFTACSLIFLGFRYIGTISRAIMWVLDLFMPLIIGVILALILNVPMSAIETRLSKHKKIKRAKKPLSIILSLILVIGAFVGIAFLVVPELVSAVGMLADIASNWIDKMILIEQEIEPANDWIAQMLKQFDIDWSGVKDGIEKLFRTQSGDIVNKVVVTAGSVIGKLVTFCVGFVFSIYILANKKKLKGQIKRLMKAWLPEKANTRISHITNVFVKVFKHFITGQTLEAIILGTLCMIGMAILRIPYAPMIGALVGVCALIPIVGAFVGTIVGAIMIVTVEPFKALIFIIFILVLQQIEGNLIYPRVVGSKINLPAMWVLAAVSVGGSLAGPIGMLLGVPTASAIYALIKEATENKEKQVKIQQNIEEK